MKKTFLWLPAVVLAFSACASTQIKSSWKDPSYSFGSIRKALVMAVVPQSTSQRVVEDAFVQHFAKRGVQAVPSYSLSPSEAKLNEEGWKRLVAENNIDSVLILRLVDVKTIEREIPPVTTTMNVNMPSYPVNAQGYNTDTGTGFITPAYNNSNWYGYYQNSYQVVSAPGYTIRDEIAVAETKVYEVGSQKLVWTGSTQTQIFPDQDTGGLLRQYAKVIVDAIYK